jgi:hypothetical protein
MNGLVLDSVVGSVRAPDGTTANGSDAPAVADTGCAVETWFRGRKPVVGIVKGGQVYRGSREHEVKVVRVNRELWLVVSPCSRVADVRAACNVSGGRGRVRAKRERVDVKVV